MTLKLTRRSINLASLLALAVLVLSFGPLNLIPILYAQDLGSHAPHAPAFGELLMRMFPMFIMVFFVFYFLVIRPQQNKLNAQDQMLKALTKGDHVITAGGILGRFSGFEDNFVLLDVGSNVRLRVERAKVVQKYEKKEPSEKKEAAG